MRKYKDAIKPDSRSPRDLNKTNPILTQQKMIRLLKKWGLMTVKEIYIKLRLEQSVASQQLAILRRAGVVAIERQGRFIYYQLIKPEKIVAPPGWFERIYKLSPFIALAKIVWELFEYLSSHIN